MIMIIMIIAEPHHLTVILTVISLQATHSGQLHTYIQQHTVASHSRFVLTTFHSYIESFLTNALVKHHNGTCERIKFDYCHNTNSIFLVLLIIPSFLTALDLRLPSDLKDCSSVSGMPHYQYTTYWYRLLRST